MGKGLTTRDAIIGEGLQQASRVGLEGLSLAPLAEALHLSKSGLFAHFKSKEALQLQIFEEALARFKRQVLAPGAGQDTPETRLRAMFERYLAWIRGSNEGGGCLFVSMAQEYDDRPGPLRDRLIEAQRAWQSHLASMIRNVVAGEATQRDTAVNQVVFEIMGAALAYQHAAKLLGDRDAHRKAMVAFDRILAGLRT
jgi:AcrR family transcriptional regulator